MFKKSIFNVFMQSLGPEFTIGRSCSLIVNYDERLAQCCHIYSNTYNRDKTVLQTLQKKKSISKIAHCQHFDAHKKAFSLIWSPLIIRVSQISSILCIMASSSDHIVPCIAGIVTNLTVFLSWKYQVNNTIWLYIAFPWKNWLSQKKNYCSKTVNSL